MTSSADDEPFPVHSRPRLNLRINLCVSNYIRSRLSIVSDTRINAFFFLFRTTLRFIRGYVTIGRFTYRQKLAWTWSSDRRRNIADAEWFAVTISRICGNTLRTRREKKVEYFRTYLLFFSCVILMLNTFHYRGLWLPVPTTSRFRFRNRLNLWTLIGRS